MSGDRERRLLLRALLLAFLLGSGAACQSSVAAPGGPVSRGQAVDFAFAGIDGDVVSDESTSGRVTVLLFATTFDLDSQAQAKQLEDLYRTHAPRVNAVLVFLEAPQYVDLARSFRDILGLSYRVALADHEEMRGGERFPAVRAVPTWIVLDRAARIEMHHEGALEGEALLGLVKKAE